MKMHNFVGGPEPFNKSQSRNGPRGESMPEGTGSNFNGDTGHDYNIM